MTMIRKSRYCILFQKGKEYLAYTSAKNSFYKINRQVADFIENFKSDGFDVSKNQLAKDIEHLHKIGLISTEKEDDDVVDNIKLRYLINSFSKETISVTLAPTIWCNLRCPYCFEESKPKDVMSDDICDKVLKFIEAHTSAKNLYLIWYGGEPLLGAKPIKYFLSKLDNLENIKLARHGMITNGTLLKGSNLDLFREKHLDSIQITIDGNKDTHDKKRIRPDGKGTYDEIIENLKVFAKEYPNTVINIRVNIDRNNVSEFMDVYNRIKDMFPDKKNIFVSPGILKACGAQSFDSPFLNNAEILNIRKEFRKKGYPVFYPDIRTGGCAATCITGYVIWPLGEIYKCWKDVGIKDKIVGNVCDMTITNSNLLSEYMLHGSHITETSCHSCPVFPICDSDCAFDRLENAFHGQQNEFCCVYKEKDNEGLISMLSDLYERMPQRE